LIADDSTAHTGKKSAKIIQTKISVNASNVKILHYNIPFEKSKTYTLAFWAKVDAREGNSREFNLFMGAMDNPITIILNKTVVLDSTEWKEYVYTFTAPDDYDSKIWLSLYVGLSDVDFWIDDVRFFEGELSDEIGNRETIIKLLNRIFQSVSWGGVKNPQ
jgi:hypothetical protein